MLPWLFTIYAGAAYYKEASVSEDFNDSHEKNILAVAQLADLVSCNQLGVVVD